MCLCVSHPSSFCWVYTFWCHNEYVSLTFSIPRNITTVEQLFIYVQKHTNTHFKWKTVTVSQSSAVYIKLFGCFVNENISTVDRLSFLGTHKSHKTVWKCCKSKSSSHTTNVELNCILGFLKIVSHIRFHICKTVPTFVYWFGLKYNKVSLVGEPEKVHLHHRILQSADTWTLTLLSNYISYSFISFTSFYKLKTNSLAI